VQAIVERLNDNSDSDLWHHDTEMHEVTVMDEMTNPEKI
jgi:hypothetical protein